MRAENSNCRRIASVKVGCSSPLGIRPIKVGVEAGKFLVSDVARLAALPVLGHDVPVNLILVGRNRAGLVVRLGIFHDELRTQFLNGGGEAPGASPEFFTERVYH